MLVLQSCSCAYGLTRAQIVTGVTYGELMMCGTICRYPDFRSRFETVNGVTAGIESMLAELRAQLKRLCWIDPSWLLVGIKK